MREVERHPFFANIPFRLYEEKRVWFLSPIALSVIGLFLSCRFHRYSNLNLIPKQIHAILIQNLPMNLSVLHHPVISIREKNLLIRISSYFSGSTESINALGMSDDAFERYDLQV